MRLKVIEVKTLHNFEKVKAEIICKK